MPSSRSRAALFVCAALTAVSIACHDETTPQPRSRAPTPSLGGVAGSTAPMSTGATAPGNDLRPPLSATMATPPGLFSPCPDCGPGCSCSPTAVQERPWDPPFQPVGAVGFKRSTEPLCATAALPFSFDVWSDGRAVYAAVSGMRAQAVPSLEPPTGVVTEEDAGVTAQPEATQLGASVTDANSLTQVWANDGRSWRLVLNELNAQANYALHGAPSAWVALSDRGVPLEFTQFMGPTATTSCTLGILKGSSFECHDLDPVNDMAVVTPNLAYALSGERRILTFDGARWHGVTPLTPLPASRIWADDHTLLAVGRAGSAMWLDGDQWRTEDLGTIEHFTAVFGSSRSDIWVGTSRGTLFHYDGTAWAERGKVAAESCDHHLPITHIWGNGDKVYFTTDAQFARWSGGSVESLGTWQCLPSDPNNGSSTPLGNGRTIVGMWGNGPDEVFLALADPSMTDNRCAPVFVVRYDGTEFHRM